MASSSEMSYPPLTNSKSSYIEDDYEEREEDIYMPDVDEKKPTRRDIERDSEVEGVLKRQVNDPYDWYAILGVSDTCSTEEANRAYKRLALAVHPDKNKHSRAEEAFKVVETAAKALKAGDDYKGADGQQQGKDPVYEFQRQEPTDFQKEIYRQATPLIQQMLKIGSNSDLVSKLEKLNKTIYDKNLAENPGADAVQLKYGRIEHDTYTSYHELHESYQDVLSEDPNTFTGSEKEVKEKKMVWTLAKTSLPSLGGILDMYNKEKGYPLEWNWPRDSYPQLFGSPSREAGSSAPTGPPSETQHPPEDTSTDPARKTPVKWKPGYTRTGEKIMAVIPNERTIYRMNKGIPGPPEKIVFGHQFIVKNEKENVIEMMSGEDVGQRATNGYLSLPEDQILDARYSERRYTRDDAGSFVTLIDWIANPHTMRTWGSSKHPRGYGLALKTNGSEDIVSRTGLRSWIGTTDADLEIQECEERKGKTPAYKIAPLGWREPKSKTIEAPTKKRLARQARVMNGYGPAADLEGLFVPQGRTVGQRDTYRRGRSVSKSSRHSNKNGERSVSRSSVYAGEIEEMKNEMAELKDMITALTLAVKGK
ncbi:hypothetical protein B0J14DRAFT_672025 [Halenospora varia]|nr:hypothetical protein B0J14DRAFT_672025 [Halenospora varia]